MPTIKRASSKPVTVKAAAKLVAAANKPGKSASATSAKRNAATVTVATPDPRVAKAERVNAERTSVYSLYHAIEAARTSVPVKPLSAFKPLPSHAHSIARKPSIRQAAAIAVCFEAAGKKLANGANAPRVFEHNGVRVAVENGVIADAISSGLIAVSGASPETETLTIRNAVSIIGLIGEPMLKRHKLL